MNWLGHFEFGLNQKPFFLGHESVFNEMQRYPQNGHQFLAAYLEKLLRVFSKPHKPQRYPV